MSVRIQRFSSNPLCPEFAVDDSGNYEVFALAVVFCRDFSTGKKPVQASRRRVSG